MADVFFFGGLYTEFTKPHRICIARPTTIRVQKRIPFLRTITFRSFIVLVPVRPAAWCSSILSAMAHADINTPRRMCLSMPQYFSIRICTRTVWHKVAKPSPQTMPNANDMWKSLSFFSSFSSLFSISFKFTRDLSLFVLAKVDGRY